LYADGRRTATTGQAFPYAPEAGELVLQAGSASGSNRR
jgi:hypothetical protein